jgi:tripartite-type tricarboxylate transporter receptor subunit TctC
MTSSISRRHLLLAASSVAGAVLAGPVIAQVGSAGSSSIMVPYPAGGASDAIARIVNTPLGKELGQTVLVENLAGVSGALGAQKVLSAPANGQLIFQGSPNELILAPLANAAVKFASEDFQLIQLICYAPIVLVARQDLPANTIDELVTLARQSAKTKPLTYGSVGVGSMYHLLAEHMGQLIQAGMSHVPYKGGPPLLQDLAGSNVDFTFLPHFAAIDGLVASGRVKILGQVGTNRAATLPKIPTLIEGKLIKDFNFSIWTGYMVKKSTPSDVVQRLQKAIHSTLLQPKVIESLTAQSQIVAKPMTLEESARFYAAETASYRSLAKAVGITPQ